MPAGCSTGHAPRSPTTIADLIACYRAVRDRPEQVIGELSRLATGHERDGAAHYYAVRNEQFNPSARAR